MRNEIDDAIVRLLVDDTRATHRHIAESLGIAESTARARVQGILDSGKVVPSVLVHPEIDSESFIYMVRMTLAEGIGAQQIADSQAAASSPWIAQVSTSGEVIVQFSARELDGMVGNLDALRTLSGVLRVQSLVVLRVYVGANWATAMEHSGQWAAAPTRSVDSVDRALVGELQNDGRASYTALAGVVGLTVAATRRRVLRLVVDGVIRFATRVSDGPTRSVEAAVDLVVATAHFPQLIVDLCAMTSVRYVIEQTGDRNLACYVVADDTAGLAKAVEAIVSDPRVVSSRTDPLLILRDKVSWTEATL